ncbi:MAG: hypothetical protein ACPGAN_04640 [Candidatus Poseidoniaceae archaeon]
MIPVEIYGVDTEVCEEFYEKLPGLVADITEDTSYSESLYSVKYGDYHSQIRIADEWAGNSPYVWPEEVWMEVEMALHATKYPDVGVIEHLTTLDGIDCVRISQWMHFSTNIYPIYSKKACIGLQKLGLKTPFRPNDMASYGLFVSRLEGLKLYAPAAGLPEIGLPRARVLQLGLERFADL